jgi:hypothetical protein
MRLHITVAVAALCLAPAGLVAQGPPRLGGQVSFAQDVNAGLGLRLELPLSPALARDLRVAVAFDYFFPDSPVNYWELNTDLAWGFRLTGTRVSLYAGAGLNIARTSVSGVPRSGATDVGVNLLGGVRFGTSTRLTPYVELRPELGGGDRLVLTAGIMF